jgi:hypothetical protein
MTDIAPRPFRVQGINGPQDCELWPDGRITMRIGREVLTTALTFDEMQAMGWTDDRITWDTEPAPDAADPEMAPDDEPTQNDLSAQTPPLPARHRRIHSIPDLNGYTPTTTYLAVALAREPTA